MRIKETFIEDSYKEFISYMTNKLSAYQLIIDDFKQRKQRLYDTIIKNSYFIAQYINVDDIVKVNTNGEGYTKLVQDTLTIIKFNKCRNEHRIYFIYIRSYLQLYKRLYIICEYLDAYYGGSLMEYKIFKKLMAIYGSAVSKLALEGKEVAFGKIGSVYCHERRQNFAEIKLKVDYDESFKLLLLKLNKIDPDIETKYKEGYLTRSNIFALGKKHKVTFIVYHNDYLRYYWMWSKMNSRLNNKNLYSFNPTHYVNIPDRKISEFIKNIKCEEDIINSDSLGNVNKLMALIKYKPTIKARYQDGV